MRRLKTYFDYFDSPLEMSSFFEKKDVRITKNYRNFKSRDYELLKNGENRIIEDFYIASSAITKIDNVNRISHNVYGLKPNIAKALTGNPRCMINIQKKKDVSNRINLVIDMAVPAFYSNERIRKIGEKIIASVKKLTLEGNQVGLYAMCASTDNTVSNCNMFITKIKDSSEPLNLSKIVYALSNPDFLRKFFIGYDSKTMDAHVFRNAGIPLSRNYSELELSRAVSYALRRKIAYINFCNQNLERFDFNELSDHLKKKFQVVDQTVFI